MARSPKELIELYWTEVWNNGNADLIREICADPILRHDPGGTTALSLEQQVNRVRQQTTHAAPFFTHEVLLADDEHVCSVWNMYLRNQPDVKLSGIEVFRARDGRFTDCWNSSYTVGYWGKEGDPPVPGDLPSPELLYATQSIGNEWMQKVLFHAGLKDIPRVSVAALEPIGAGNLSNTVRVPVRYNGDAEGLPSAFVCKFSPTHPIAASVAYTSGACAREAKTYELLAKDAPCRAPKPYLSAFDPETGVLNLVLEDLSGLTPGDQIAGCTPAQAAAVANELAALHCTYLGKADKTWTWLNTPSESAETRAESFAVGAAVMKERLRDRHPEEDWKLMDTVLGLVGPFTARQPKNPTLIHGELRVDNAIFDMSDPAAPLAYLIDWQFTALQDPIFDIAYLLSGSLSPEDRRACERDIVDRHTAALKTKDPSYPADRAWTDYQMMLVSGLIATVDAANVLPDSDGPNQLLSVLFGRNCAAVKDHKVHDRLADWLKT